MASRPSGMSDNAASPPTSSSTDSYIGSLISVTSKSEIRYEGVLYYLNPQDSTLGLKNVRSYGTEGRNKNGPQVPAGDKVYEYILFRGSDIKDLQVKTAPPARTEEALYNDPAIITSNYCAPPSSSSKSASTSGGSLPESNLWSGTSGSNARSYPSVLPLHHAGPQLGMWGPPQSTASVASSYGMPTQWQAYGAPGTTAGTQQHSFTSDTMFHPLQNQQSTTMDVTNLSTNLSPGHSLAIPSSGSFNATPTLSSENLFAPFANSLSSKTSPPFHHPTLINSNGLAMPFSMTYQNASSVDPQVVNKVIPDPVSSIPVQPFPYTASSVSDPISDSLLSKQPALLTPNQAQPKLFELSPENKLRSDLKDMGVMSSIPLNSSSSATTPAVQPPLLPLPPPSQKLQSSVQFTEEFDFQAMNEKFKKDEVWGHLGKANQRDKPEVIQENGSSGHDSGDDNPDLVSKSDPKPAYNKDDFFDTISCNSVGRGAKNGQNRYSERVKLDTQTFGNFQRRPQVGYGGRGQFRGPQNNWGRGWYDYGNRGRGGYTRR